MSAAPQSEQFESSALYGDVMARAASYSRERVAIEAIRRLDLRRTDHVLELGCGSGHLLGRVAVRTPGGFATGIDPSPLMVRHARVRNRRLIDRGRAEIEVGASSDLSRFAAGRFQKVYGLHVVYFWESPLRDLDEIRRVLTPGGRLLLGFCPSVPTARDRARCAIANVEGWLEETGFVGLEGGVEWYGERPLAWIAARV